MKRILRLLCAALALAVALPLVPGLWESARAEQMGTVSFTVTQNYREAQRVLKQVNKQRRKAGLNEVQLDAELCRTAVQRAAEGLIYMPDESPHRRPNGLLRQSLSGRINYEDMAWGHSGAKEVVSSWMNSPVHRAGILLSGAKSIGVACICDDIWVLHLSKSAVGTVETSKEREKRFTIRVESKPEYLAEALYLQIFWNMTVGEKETIHVCCGAQTPIKPSNFTWKSSKPSVATVNAKGKVTPKKKGSFTLTATLKSNPNIVVKQKIKVVK